MFDPKELKEALQFAYKSRATIDNRPVLTCVYFDFSVPGRCSVVGANGYTLHYTTIRANFDTSFLMSKEAAQKLMTGIKKTGASVEMAYDKTHGKITFTQTYKGKPYTWESIATQGKFPDWRGILPNEDRPQHLIELSYQTLDMIKSVFNVFVGVQLYAKDGILHVRGGRGMYDAYPTEMVTPEKTALPDDYLLGINPTYLFNASRDEQSIILQVDSGNHFAPFRVSGGCVSTYGSEYTALIMPCKID
jgi:DNA polymerase III sliding clamp (beta) subunit (PCNA family)